MNTQTTSAGAVENITIATETGPVQVAIDERGDITISKYGWRLATISSYRTEEELSRASIGYGKHLLWSKDTQSRIRGAVAELFPEAKKIVEQKRIEWELGRDQRRLLREQEEREFAAEVERTGRKPSEDWDYNELRGIWMLGRDSKYTHWDDEFAHVEEVAPGEFEYSGNHYGGSQGTESTLIIAQLRAEDLWELEELEREDHFKERARQRRKWEPSH
jgi:hypothetical protein